jgi:hypothetical protein
MEGYPAMPLLLVGILSLALGTVAVMIGRMPVTEKRVWKGAKAKRVGWVCWAFGILCIGLWVWLVFDKYVVLAR